MLGWFLNLLVALLTASVMSLLLSTMYIFSFIPRFFVAFLKKLFRQLLFSHLTDVFIFIYNVILLTVFRFSEKKG